MRFVSAWFVPLAASAITLSAWGAGCGSSKTDSGFPQSSSSSSGGSGGGSDATASSSSGAGSGSSGGSAGNFGDASYMPPPQESGVGCTNLQCQVHSCGGGGGDGGASTTISGKVMDPAGHNPLYNVVVYIPNSQGGVLDSIPIGINSLSCSCDALFSGEPMAIALTQPDGTFTIKNAPDGKNIPLVVQIGKWRKEITIPNVTACQDNAQGNINLPKNHTDGMYASLPNIAVSTGFADTLECLLTRVGVDEAEYSGDPNTGAARVHVFQGGTGCAIGGCGNSTQNPSSPASSASLWDSDSDLERYDIVMLSCEGSPTTGANAQTLSDYVTKGGRVFAEHYHYAFFANQSQFANTADWSQSQSGNDSYTGAITGQVQTTLLNGNPFPEGQALETWLGDVGAATNGALPITVARHDALVGTGNVSTPWIQAASGTSPMSSQYFSWDMPFNAPVNDAGVPQYCGRVVFSDLHVSGTNGPGGIDYTSSKVVPTGCDSTATLQPDEDALEFILFDLSSCITPVGFPPKPPMPPPEAGTAQ